jgi:CPA1 family monovalent cation:H+ antiporter
MFNIFGAGMTIGMYVALFSMNMATDAISVGNIFSQFKGVPHNIKVLVEGESLGNDATAMIAFYFVGLPWILNGYFDISSIPWITVKVFGLSAIIGLIVGFIGYILLSLFNSVKEELLIIIAVAYASFAFSEFIHVSGIFALIVGVITLKTLIDKNVSKEIKDTEEKYLARAISKTVTTKTRQEDIINTIDMFSFLAVVLVFVSMASMINFNNLLFYWKEISIMFIATTIIRALVMLKFLIVGKATKKIDYVGFNGWVILTLAGIKGSLSIIMLHAIPKEFAYYELFESVTIGVILLSTFVYGITLLLYMTMQEKKHARI